jgi:two-component system chemotaxis sensor kinase CheA
VSDPHITPSNTPAASANRDLAEMTDRLAAAAVMASKDDLPLLTDIHDQFERLAKAAPGGGVAETASAARQLVERIILNDVDDAEKALRIVSERVGDLQELVRRITEGAEDAAVPMAARAEDGAPGACPAAAAEAEEEAGHADDGAWGPVTLNEADLPLVHEFIGEATAHLESAEAELLKLEENPSDAEAINAVFRSFHTIKGVAGFMNLTPITTLAHAAENLLDLLRHGKLALTPGVIDVVLASSDAMKGLVSGLDAAAKNGTTFSGDVALAGLVERIERAARGEATGGAGKEVEPVNAPAVARAGGVDLSARPASIAPGEGEAGGPTAKADATKQQAAASHGGQDATVKVSTDRLDNLINMVGELVIAQAMVRQDLIQHLKENQRLARNSSQLGKITRELQALSMSMRMVPIQGVFQKMSRLVRDLGRKFCKDIDLVLTGAETELDRNVVEAISDPLVHMVRNSVDHGLETPDQREKAGKGRTGRVELKAYHEAGNIVIEIRDDGRGINKKRLIDKATAAGIIKEGQTLTEQETFKLVFAAGLSTAEKVTDVSGRGVGMDVVKRNVEALRGRIDIASTEGAGSTFTIRLPLTLAVIDGLVVKVGGERYILPITSIEQSLQPKAAQLSTVQGRGEMCMVRDRLLPLFRLHRLFGVTPRTEDPTQALVVIVQDNDRRCCLLVDELLGQQQVVIKSLAASLGNVPGVSGGAILGDGNVSLILDVVGLMDVAGTA